MLQHLPSPIVPAKGGFISPTLIILGTFGKSPLIVLPRSLC
jgi:hypothetical protein